MRRQRTSIFWACSVALAALALTACGDSADPGQNDDPSVSERSEPVSGTSADTEWCQALAVFRTRCQGCHGAELAGGAPMPLVTYADMKTEGEDGGSALVDRISARIHDDKAPMPPTSQDPLTDKELAALDAWIDAGAPSADDNTCGGEWSPDAGAEFEWPEDCEEFYTFTSGAGEPHLVEANTETHPAFYFDVPWGGKGPVQALAFRPITDNKRVLHHWILNEGERNFLTGWAPGGQPLVNPEGVGTYLPESGQLKLDMHYYNLQNDQDEYDQSGVEICITRTLRESTSTVYPFAASAYAPAHERVENENTCTVQKNTDEPVYLLTSSPHMHQFGVHAKLEIIRKDGSVEVVHDKPFSFDDQVSVDVGPIELFDGDQISMTCVYQNDTSRTANFGEGSNDEMCFNFASYYPMCGMTCTGGSLIARGLTIAQGGGCPNAGGIAGSF